MNAVLRNNSYAQSVSVYYLFIFGCQIFETAAASAKVWCNETHTHTQTRRLTLIYLMTSRAIVFLFVSFLTVVAEVASLTSMFNGACERPSAFTVHPTADDEERKKDEWPQWPPPWFHRCHCHCHRQEKKDKRPPSQISSFLYEKGGTRSNRRSVVVNVALMIYLVAHQRTVRECTRGYKGEIDGTVTAQHWCERKSKTERLQAL